MGLRLPFSQESHPYNRDDISAASNTLRFTTNEIPLFLFTKDTNFKTWHIFIIACSFIADDTQPSLVKGEPIYI